ncbi:hypothetical protein [Chakrabartyella piscis]|uniref:hypothetical protein n=1 Tax=Chakrabartyella piscis TaxID=2918914 RepID=UPI002958DA82|nr:hypothetical protein [Chakrabartyella piscis]
MNLLKEGKEQKKVIATQYIKPLTIDGNTQDYPVYEIKLDQLFYNDQNDRIATWISQYKEENEIDSFDMRDMEKYNELIGGFVTESKPDKMKNTQNLISLFGQKISGVVLADGRIIDGNRRFTCLRNIQKEKCEAGYFEAVILDRDINDNSLLRYVLLYLKQRATT